MQVKMYFCFTRAIQHPVDEHKHILFLSAGPMLTNVNVHLSTGLQIGRKGTQNYLKCCFSKKFAHHLFNLS